MVPVAVFVESGVFWAAVGALATVGGTGVAAVHLRGRRGDPGPPPSSDIEKLEDPEAFIAAQLMAIRNARIAVSLRLHTVHASSFDWRAEKINEALKAARDRGVTVRVLAGRGPEQVAGAFELAQAGVEVRLNTELLHSDWRSLKVDSAQVLVGIADVGAESVNYKPSHSWVELTTFGVGDLLERDFQRLWISGDATDLYGYLSNYVNKVKDHVSLSRLAEDFGLPNDKLLSTFYRRPKLAELMHGTTYVFLGKAASGKSTLMKQVAEAAAARRLDLEDFVLPYVFRHGNENVVGDKILDMYREVVEAVKSTEYDLVEVGSEYAAQVLPEVFAGIRNHGRKPVLVHCNASLDVALRRNGDRVRPVPVEVIQAQSREEEGGSFREVCEASGVPICSVRTDRKVPALEVFEKIIQVQHQPI